MFIEIWNFDITNLNSSEIIEAQQQFYYYKNIIQCLWLYATSE